MAAAGAESTVRMPGIVLSSLMFDHLNTNSDVVKHTNDRRKLTLLFYFLYGLILGESLFEEQVTINDSQADQIHIEEIYNIQKHIPCKKLHSTGEVDLDALKKLLGDCKHESIIGWYKQRRNTDQQMTLREKTIHKNLKNTLSNPHMIFLLLTPSYSTLSGSTHKTEYAAYILRCRQAINVPVLVNNLGLLEPVSYCKVPALCSAVGFSLTMQKHRSKFFSSKGLLNEVEEINSVNDSLQSELYNMCQDVESTEKQLEALQAEVSALRSKVIEEKQYRLQNEHNDPPLEPKNLLLQNTVRALFACSPLFQSQTLTTSAFPILDCCCNLQTDKETLADQSDRPSEEDMVCQRKWVSRKRPTELSLRANDHKRRKI
ncbi:BRCA1-A complex subunit Abraxas 1 isoform X3 [Boleophthalmus pectinirostris]|uniref:BRCA1-A complex subunit Abraxas 1 isoform X3 n=1 Tax=Boleophthalmus pectinirostris TaxID=150288 RepID=UPI002432CFE2|nr:BRCA1-A complex subunit Abraxas 1 isoform X3 [Boleophthalmus pectinirostris]